MVQEDAGVKVQTERDVRTYQVELSLDSAESLFLQENCARHGWPREKYRRLEYANHLDLLERRERELSGRGPEETETDMTERKRRALTLAELKRALEASSRPLWSAEEARHGRGGCKDTRGGKETPGY